MEKKRFCSIVLFFVAPLISFTQNINKEQKAIEYFCNNLEDIKRETDIKEIVFDGKSQGIASSAFDIAYCLGEINYLKDSVPNQAMLDSIDKANSKLSSKSKQLNFCWPVTKLRCNRKSKFTLYVFESIRFNNAHYVELYLKNKRMKEVWIICLKFDETGTDIINRCSQYIHYSGY